MELGTNYHLDSLRPWTAWRGLERDLIGIAHAGFDLVRIVGELVLPTADGVGVARDDLWRSVSELSAELDLDVLALCWNVVADEALRGRPLTDAEGFEYDRGHWGLFNFMNSELRQIALHSLQTIARAIGQPAGIVCDFQPTNEWLLAVYEPNGWDWYSYAGEMTRTMPTQVMYDDDSIRAWHSFVEQLPGTWRDKIRAESGAIPAPPDLDSAVWSPTAAAWAEFRATLIGDFLVDVYDAVKAVAPDMHLLSQSTMPVIADWAGLRTASYGHNPAYWFKRGKSCDYLAVNTYDHYTLLEEHAALGDNSLELWGWLALFAEIVRVHGLSGLYVTEIGANSYWHSEDAQRYLAMRSILAAAHFSPEKICHLLWNDEPRFEGINEQFFGAVRDQHLQPKPLLVDLETVLLTIRRANPAAPPPGSFACVLPRRSMDLGLELSPPNVMAARGRATLLTTEDLIAEGGLPEGVTGMLIAGSHLVGGLQALEYATSRRIRVTAPGALGRHGFDDDAAREHAIRAAFGIAERRYENRTGALIDLADGQRLELQGSYDVLAVDPSDLPAEAAVVATFDDGAVAAYRLGLLTVCALPPVETTIDDDAAMSRYLTAVTASSGSGVPFDLTVEHDSTGGRISFWTVGTTIVAVNNSDRPGAIHLRDASALYTLSVAARRFSAVERAARPAFAVLSGTGTVSVESWSLTNEIADAVIVFDDGTITASARWSATGSALETVSVNGTPATRQASESTDAHVAGSLIGDTFVVTADVRPVVRGSIVYAREVDLRHHSEAPENGHHFGELTAPTPPGTHVVTGSAGRATLSWRSSEQVDFRVLLRSTSIDGVEVLLDDVYSAGAHTQHLDVPRVAAVRNARISVAIEAVTGALPDDLAVTLLYETEEAPLTLVTQRGAGAERVRFLHPMAREHDRVVDTRTEVRWGDTWRPALLHIGQPGLHTRHLQLSEDWIDVRR
jgi:hypothetical protein